MEQHHRDLVDILQALLTPLIACIAVGIAFAQWFTARNRFKLDLFDRRWAVYEAVMQLLAAMTSHGATSREDDQKFLVGIRGAKWLFNSEIETYLLKEVWARACELNAVNSMLEPTAPQYGREGHAKRKMQLMQWVGSQYSVVDSTFSEFLQMDPVFSDWARSTLRRFSDWTRSELRQFAQWVSKLRRRGR
ncbi:MAG TPA: hypothetical protein VLX85_01895 [Stellaceae bacterium]|nr:hypothetical protein [Stellaceae bacterium]